MTIIAVFNQKGGVGKTTTALNLSAALARHGRRPVGIDLDPQAQFSSISGFAVHSGDDSIFCEINLTCNVKLISPANCTQPY